MERRWAAVRPDTVTAFPLFSCLARNALLVIARLDEVALGGGGAGRADMPLTTLGPGVSAWVGRGGQGRWMRS